MKDFWRLGRWRVLGAISLGAIAGAFGRYYGAIAINHLSGKWPTAITGGTFPLGTMVVNLTGAFGLGFFVTWATSKTRSKTQISTELELAIVVGFFGAYTTFSTYELETETLLLNRAWLLVAMYWGSTAILGVLCLEAGSCLASFLARKLS